ncbi:MAG: transporter [Paludibacter sp.]
MLKKIKSYLMPVAMLTGIALHEYVGQLSFLMEYLLFVMLLFTYSKISISTIRFTAMHFWLLLIQVGGSFIVYLALKPINEILAQAAMISILAPTATAAPVIAGMLKGNVASLTAYSLLSNLTVAIVAPVYFSYVGYNELPFLTSVFEIGKRVAFLLIVPFFISLIINKFLPQLGKQIQAKSGLSFYLWIISLTVVTGKTVQFIIEQGNTHIVLEIAIGLASMFICIGQFVIGRRIGRKLDDTVAGGQGLGQKNTVLAIWMSLMYLHPLASIGPGAYVLWQNSVNSYQVWKQNKSSK